MNKPDRRRLFYSYNKKDFYQIFSFKQHKDGSIYCWWPDFKDTIWIGCKTEKNYTNFELVDTPKNSEKLSIHGSGIVKFESSELILSQTRIKGQFLYKPTEKLIAPRHLFTAFLSQPKHLTNNSNYKNRDSDTEILATTHKPFVILFFAIPQQTPPIETNFMPYFHEDLFEGGFSLNIGLDHFSLGYHDIIWFIYATKFMSVWPKQSHFIYFNGFTVPLLIGQKHEQDSKLRPMKIAMQEPEYQLKDNVLNLILPFPTPEEIL